MNNWYMLTLVGEDSPGIVAKVTTALYKEALSLGETSMIRLGGNFTIMMMVKSHLSESAIRETLASLISKMDLCMHIDPIQGHLHDHVVPNVTVRVNGADQVGIISMVTTALAETGFNILDLSSDVVGNEEEPLYLMMIEGYSDKTIEELQEAVDRVVFSGVDVVITPIEMMVG